MSKLEPRHERQTFLDATEARHKNRSESSEPERDRDRTRPAGRSIEPDCTTNDVGPFALQRMLGREPQSESCKATKHGTRPAAAKNTARKAS
jgi:hypothetical protein